ncbi:MAG TPA: hypothetical protein VM534_02325 [Thermoanaerobaculia bacterium]|nr:hypothetical protein [Thermoanaerobaculia bacterium]
MRSLRHWIRISLALAVLAIAALGLAHLALTDISHDERDLTLEWNALRLCFGVFLVFVAISTTTLLRALRFASAS